MPFQLSDQQLTQLAMEYDPAPVLNIISAQASPAGGNFLTSQGPTQGPGMSYADIVGAGVGASNQQSPKAAAPLDPSTLALLGRMQPQPGGVPAAPSPRARGPVQLGPIAQLTKPQQPPSLAQILGVR